MNFSENAITHQLTNIYLNKIKMSGEVRGYRRELLFKVSLFTDKRTGDGL